MNKFCIVIPIYKETLDCIEELSLKRLQQVIGDKDYDVIAIIPELLDISKHKEIFPKLQFVEFDKSMFESTYTYSQLCISYDFYSSFDDYEYMYIYQLDCYIFKDNFEYWCNQGYDYIGGPILSTDCGWDTVKRAQRGKYTPYVGNGGFSIRKISTFKDITNPKGEFRNAYPEITEEFLKKVHFEDKYFCNDLYNMYYINVPNWQEALKFGMDMSVDIIFNNMHYTELPMVCHAWDKNIRYWKDVIPEITNEIVEYCEEKHKEFFKLYYDENNSTLR